MAQETCKQVSDFLQWMDCHEGLAGYLQAVGTVLAILGSALLTYWSTKRMLSPTIEERSDRVRVLLYRLLPPISDVQATSVRVRRAFNETEHGFMFAATDKLEEAAWAFRIDARLQDDILAEIHVLPRDLAQHIAELHYYHSRYNEFVRLNVPLMRGLEGDRRQRFVDTFDTLLGTVEELSKSVLQSMQTLRRADDDK